MNDSTSKLTAQDLSQAQKDVNTIAIALVKLKYHFEAFGMRMPSEYQVALERLIEFHKQLLQTNITIEIEEENND